MAPRILTPKNLSTFDIRQDGDRVILIFNGRRIAAVPWDAALDIARAIHIKAKLAEEWAHAESIAFDQAVLTRLGAPIGLTNNKHIRREALKEAAWNRDLRRYIRGRRARGIESQETFGAPIIIKEDSRGKKSE